MRARFLHTSDWQLGVTRQFFEAEAQALWAAARFEAIRKLGKIAVDEKCEFIVVAGDIFETNQVDRRTIVKACEVMSEIPVPIFLLPANHDPLDAGSVYLSKSWRDRKPSQVQVLDGAGSLVQVRPGVEVVGAPWSSKRPLSDLVAKASANLLADPGTLRVMVAHGATDELSPNPDDPAIIHVADADKAIEEGRYHYLALGDRHSFTKIGKNGRIFYSGTHEAYDFGEVDPGNVLIVDLSAEGVSVTPRKTGTWHFIVHETHVSTADDVEALGRYLDSLQGKACTVLKLGLVGTLNIRLHERLEEIEEHARDLLAAVIRSSSRSELVVAPDNSDFDNLSLMGFAASTVEKLRALAEVPGPQAEQASDALSLLLRLAGRTA
jgi:DNA repair exonuclease SbcCD nuclease subunit